MTNLDSIFKSRDITLPTKVHLVKAMVFPVVMWRKLSTEELLLLNCGVGEDSWESLGLQGDPTSPFWRRSVLDVHWKDWCSNWNSNTLATWCEGLTHLKRPWCWERLKAGGEGDDRGWDGWMAPLNQWTWVWVDLGVGDGQGGPACCDSWGRKESDTTERLNWTVGVFNISLKATTISICIYMPIYTYVYVHTYKFNNS